MSAAPEVRPPGRSADRDPAETRTPSGAARRRLLVPARQHPRRSARRARNGKPGRVQLARLRGRRRRRRRAHRQLMHVAVARGRRSSAGRRRTAGAPYHSHRRSRSRAVPGPDPSTSQPRRNPDRRHAGTFGCPRPRAGALAVARHSSRSRGPPRGRRRTRRAACSQDAEAIAAMAPDGCTCDSERWPLPSKIVVGQVSRRSIAAVSGADLCASNAAARPLEQNSPHARQAAGVGIERQRLGAQEQRRGRQILAR